MSLQEECNPDASDGHAAAHVCLEEGRQLEARGDVDDHGVADGLARLLEVGERCAGHIEGADAVDLHDGSEALARQALRRREEVARGAVDEDVQLAEGLHGGLDGVVAALLRAHVAAHLRRLDALRLQHRDGVVQHVGAACGRARRLTGQGQGQQGQDQGQVEQGQQQPPTPRTYAP